MVLQDEIVKDSSGAYNMKILDINEEWLKVEYERRKEGTLFGKETVAKLVDLSLVDGIEVEVTES